MAGIERLRNLMLIARRQCGMTLPGRAGKKKEALLKELRVPVPSENGRNWSL